MYRIIPVIVFLFFKLSTGSITTMAQDSKSETTPVSNSWLEILDREVRANGGRIPVDTLISVVVDHEGSGKAYSEPATEREKTYVQAFIKLRSLATALYKTEEGRKAYLELFNPDFLDRIAERLDFDLSKNKRVNLLSEKFTSADMPFLLEYIHHNMTYVLNLEPFFTKTYSAYGSEDDTKNYDPAPGKNGLFRMTGGNSNGQTVRVNFSEKLGQMALLTTWLIEGNSELGIQALGIRHPVVTGLLVYHMDVMEHDSFHALQYFFNPVDYLNRLVDREQPEVMNPESPQYGLIRKELVEKARFKLFYEMDGFYISGFFRRGHESETLEAADLIEDMRSGKDIIRGLTDAGIRSSKINPFFDKGSIMEWLQDGTNSRDIVNVYLRADGGNPESNLWFLNDEKVLPESMCGFMFTQFDPAIAVDDLEAINEKLAAGKKFSGVQKKQITRQVYSIMKVWESSVEVQRANGGLNAMMEEFPYLKPVIDRYEGNPSSGILGEINRFRQLAKKRELHCQTYEVSNEHSEIK